MVTTSVTDADPSLTVTLIEYESTVSLSSVWVVVTRPVEETLKWLLFVPLSEKLSVSPLSWSVAVVFRTLVPEFRFS